MGVARGPSSAGRGVQPTRLPPRRTPPNASPRVIVRWRGCWRNARHRRHGRSRRKPSQHPIAIARAGNVVATLVGADADSPDHPRALSALTCSYALTCFVERTWRFAVPLLLAGLLAPASAPPAIAQAGREAAFEAMAAVGLIAQCAMATSGMWIGAAIDRVPRWSLLAGVLLAQGLAVLCACACVCAADPARLASDAVRFKSSALFCGLAVACVLERVSALGSDVAMERDWIVQLVGRSNDQALARANARLRGIDMASEVIGPAVFGVALGHHGVRFTAAASLALVACFLPLQLGLAAWAHHAGGQALLRKSGDSSARKDVRGDIRPARALRRIVAAGSGAWASFARQRTLPVSLARVFANASVLYPGTLTVAYLASVGVRSEAIGAFRGAAAASSCAATVVAAAFIRRCGLRPAGLVALACEFAGGCLAAACFGITFLPGFLAWIVLLRFAHTCFDMAATQIVQMEVDPSEAGAVNACEAALSSLVELATYALCCFVCKTPERFHIAVVYSIGIVAASVALYRAAAIGADTGEGRA